MTIIGSGAKARRTTRGGIPSCFQVFDFDSLDKAPSAKDTVLVPATTKWSSTLTSTRASACFYEKEFEMRSTVSGA